MAVSGRLTRKGETMATRERIGPYYTEPITRERIERLVRIYHTSNYAAAASGLAPGSVQRAAKRFGLKFRHERSRKGNPSCN